MKTVFGIFILTLIATAQALATAQEPDRIIYEGKEYSLTSNPMESYFRQHPEKKPKGEVMSTALWRGYIATFEVKEDRLLLKDIAVETWTRDAGNPDPGAGKSGLKSVRKDLVADAEVLPLDWFSGILVIPTGKLVDYVHMGYASTYSSYTLLEVKNGRITRQRQFDQGQYEAFREKQFQAFKKTDDYKQRFAALQKQGQSAEFIESFLRIYVVDYTSEFLDEPTTQPATRP